MDLYERAARFPVALGMLPRRRVVTNDDIRPDARHRVDRRVRRGAMHRPFRGTYLFGRSRLTLVERVRAALEVAPDGTVVGFHTAAMLQGFGVIESSDVHLVVPAGTLLPRRRGLIVHQSVVPILPVSRFGLPCTPPALTAIDLARVLPRMDALPVLDAALFAKACRRADLIAQVDDLRGFKGTRQARELALLADERPECRQESQLRLILHDGGFTGFIPQHPVDAGPTCYYLDLGDPALKVGVEYDGVTHADKARLGPDRARHNALADLDWRMRYATRDDIYFRQAKILASVAKAVQR
jgi:very-short-patch-repair endonuclease